MSSLCNQRLIAESIALACACRAWARTPKHLAPVTSGCGLAQHVRRVETSVAAVAQVAVHLVLQNFAAVDFHPQGLSRRFEAFCGKSADVQVMG